MIVNLGHLQRQFLVFAEAFLETGARQCRHLSQSPGQYNYAHGAVVMSLVYHGVELFLKAAILRSIPEERFSGFKGHDLKYLHRRYRELYPTEDHEIPFTTDEPDRAVLESMYEASPVEAVLTQRRKCRRIK
jgi:hypothetical protein